MSEETKRFFVRNIPPSASESDIRTFFKKLGSITDVSISQKPNGAILFFTATGPANAISKATKSYAGKNWNNYNVSIEEAKKDNFMARLVREREESLLLQKDLDTVKQEELVNGFPPRKKQKKNVRKKKESSSDNNSSDDESTRAGIPSFHGTQYLYNGTDKTVNGEDVLSSFSQFDSMWADSNDEESSPNLSSLLNKSKQERRLKNKDDSTVKKKKLKKQDISTNFDNVNDHPIGNLEVNSTLNSSKHEVSTKGEKRKKEKLVNKEKSKTPLTKDEKKKRDDERRRKSLLEKEKLKRSQQTLIKTALSSGDGGKSKKIIFDNNSEDEPLEEISESKKRGLFDGEDDDEEIVIPNSAMITDEQSHELLKLKSRFNHDERFKMDERFLDDSKLSEDDNEARNSKKVEKGPIEMVRFDPAKASLRKQEPATIVKKLKKQESVKVVSKEKFYEVDTKSIKLALQEGSSGFSLLAAYGGTDRNKKEDIKGEQLSPKKIVKKNPLLDDSSDDEVNAQDADELVKPWAPVLNLPLEPRDNFFFSNNDSSFVDALKFINQKETDEAKAYSENYETTRRLLKRVFKEQRAKRNKKADMFKKKVGGMKKSIRRFSNQTKTPNRKNKVNQR